MNNGHQAPPYVNNGVMFVSTSHQPADRDRREERRRAVALPEPERPDARVSKPVNRGPGALRRQGILRARRSGTRRRSTRRAGKESLDERPVEDNKKGYYMTAAPLIADGKVIVGISGGDGPTRGFVAAYDAATGKECGDCFTIPAPGEPGSETWPQGDQWKTGGGAIWVTGNYDPETNLRVLGRRQRQSVGRVDSARATTSTPRRRSRSTSPTGKIKGHFQYTPNEAWDWDEVVAADPDRLPAQRPDDQGPRSTSRAAATSSSSSARSDKIKFVEGKPYVKQDIFKSLDPKTGRPDVDPDHKRRRRQARQTSARRGTAGRTGNRARSTRRRG